MQANSHEQIALSSRVRLARNYQDIAFPSMMKDSDSTTVLARTKESLQKHTDLSPIHMVSMAELNTVARQELVERHMISLDLAKNEHGALIELMNQQVCVMVNEEDHLRIQAILPGLQLGKAMELANGVDEVLEEGGFAFDHTLGYLTACPTNTGSGMRASIMLHLPALTMLSQMGPIVRTVSRIGLTVRGLYGEGSEASGNMYQLSNQVTLGRNETEIIHMLNEAAMQVIARESEARSLMQSTNPLSIEDRLMRSYGTLLGARKIDIKEFMQRMSDVRLAMDMGFVSPRYEQLDLLMINAQPAAIQRALGIGSEQEAVNAERARLVRQALSPIHE